MKKKMIACSVFLAEFLCGVFNVDAMTYYGMDTIDVNYHGEIYAGSCNIKAGTDQTVNLGDFSTIAFSEADDVSTAVPFSVIITCPEGGPAQANVTFSGAAAADPNLLKLDSVAGSASGVAVRINQGSGSTQLKLNTPSANTVLVTGDNKLEFNAQYQSLGTRQQIVAGIANATAQFTINYP